jgi:uncharacterized protein (TIGR03083 family)
VTLAYPEYVAAVRREGSAVVAAASLGLDSAVPACPGWTTDDLVVHLGRLWAYVASLLSSRATEASQRPPLPEGDRLAVVSDLLDDLVGQLAALEPQTPVWNWSGEPDVAQFWARRMAHEAAVHRFDAQQAHGVAQPIDEDLASDGLDEFIDVLIPRVLSRDAAELTPGTLVLRTADGERVLALTSTGLHRADAAGPGATVVGGTASALLLACLGRLAWSSLEVEGDPSVLDGWSAALRF